MLSPVIALLSLSTLVTAHSWLHCTSHNNTGILAEMKANAWTTPEKDIDPLMPWYADLCHGWPRAKQNPGFWATEGVEYLWTLPKAQASGDTHACHPSQRAPIQYLTNTIPQKSGKQPPVHNAPAPMATASARSSIKLMVGGNGHSRGNFGGVNIDDPGKVFVYWAGAPEKEIVHVKELTPNILLQENGFSDESYAWPEDKSVTDPCPYPLLRDKGNWQTLHLPAYTQNGRHMMVWVWSFGGVNKFSTCFDVMIV